MIRRRGTTLDRLMIPMMTKNVWVMYTWDNGCWFFSFVLVCCFSYGHFWFRMIAMLHNEGNEGMNERRNVGYDGTATTIMLTAEDRAYCMVLVGLCQRIPGVGHLGVLGASC